MFQAAAFFGAGLLAKDGCAQIPACSTKTADGSTPFKLAVQVHAAWVPSLGEPGLVMRLRPRLVVGFAGVWKETEFADFAGGAHQQAGPPCNGDAFTVAEPSGQAKGGCIGGGHGGKPPAGANAVGDAGGGPWCFGDTLTFSAQARDILRGGVRLRLSAHSDVVLGPLQVDLPRSMDMGEAVVDLQSRALPACAPVPDRPGPVHQSASAGGGDHLLVAGNLLFDGRVSPVAWWETPVLVVPLTRVSDSPHSGVEVSTTAHVALSLRVNADPEVLVREAEDSQISLADRVERAVDHFAQWMQAPIEPLTCTACNALNPDCTEAAVTPRCQSYRPPCPVGPKMPEDEPEAEASPVIAVPAAAGWAFKL